MFNQRGDRGTRLLGMIGGQAFDSCNSQLGDRFDPESLEGISRIARIAGLTPAA
jgi:hypothetical protein